MKSKIAFGYEYGAHGDKVYKPGRESVPVLVGDKLYRYPTAVGDRDYYFIGYPSEICHYLNQNPKHQIKAKGPGKNATLKVVITPLVNSATDEVLDCIRTGALGGLNPIAGKVLDADFLVRGMGLPGFFSGLFSANQKGSQRGSRVLNTLFRGKVEVRLTTVLKASKGKYDPRHVIKLGERTRRTLRYEELAEIVAGEHLISEKEFIAAGGYTCTGG